MRKILIYIFVTIITSAYFFPLIIIKPNVNSKMILAAIGVFLLILDKTRSQSFKLSIDFLYICLWAALTSIWGHISMAYNHTSETFMATYLTSLLVWAGGAYSVIRLIEEVHGSISIKLVGNYLISVCVAQCIIAYIGFINPVVHDWLIRILGDNVGFMGAPEGRMFGLGAALDPAGLRFAAVLTIIACLAFNRAEKSSLKENIFYLISFFIISLFGNMISRSTIIGVILALLYTTFFFYKQKRFSETMGFMGRAIIIVAVIVISLTLLYRTDAIFKQQIRFGFEGFFSLFEKGKWETNSNNILKTMIIWPETLKTWLIGDGYALNPYYDPNYLGEKYSGFYKGTDIGYLRYIYYFGLPGLILLSCVFFSSTRFLSSFFKEYKTMFILLLIANMIGWLKVSSDIIMVFCPFLVLMFRLQSKESDENSLLHSVNI